MKLYTWQQFKELKKNSDPVLIQDAWVWHIEKALKSGINIPDKIKLSHPEITFDNKGNPYYRKYIVNQLF